MSEQDEIRLAAVFASSALFLRREFLGRDIESKEAPSRDQTIYLYDTNVIAAFSEPWFSGPLETSANNEDEKERQSRSSNAQKKRDKRKMAGLGAIFPRSRTQDQEVSEQEEALIIAALTEFALVSLRNKGIPVYQTPGHFTETSEIFKNVRYFHDRESRQLRSPMSREELAKARVIAANISIKQQTGHSSSQKALMPLVEQLLNAIDRTSDNLDTEAKRTIQRWKRFERLNHRVGGIYPANNIPMHLAASMPLVAEALEAFNISSSSNPASGNNPPPTLQPDEVKLLSVLKRHYWKTIFRARSRGRKRLPPEEELRISNDVDALSLIFLANWRLVQLSPEERKKSGNWRVVFVTTDRALTEIGYSQIEGLPQSLPLQTFAANFSQNYLRHLWAYTSEALIEPDALPSKAEGADHDKRHDFINWLDGLLVEWSEDLHFDFRHLGRIRTQIIDKIKQMDQGRIPDWASSPATGPVLRLVTQVDDGLKHWHSLIEEALTNTRFKALGEEKKDNPQLISRVLNRIASERGEGKPRPWGEVVTMVQEEYDRHKDEIILEFSNIGVEAIITARATGKRNPPDLFFDTLKATNNIFRTLSTPEAYTDKSMKQFEQDYELIAQECHNPSQDGDNRELCHLRYIVLGAAFASADRWGVALSQGRRALRIIERTKARNLPKIKVKNGDEKITNISGREAYFLCASAYRMIASNPAGFNRARRYLDDAVSALDEDKSLNYKNKSTYVRFRTEYLALALSEYYHMRSMDPGNLFDEMVEEIHRRAADVLEEFKVEGCPFEPASNFRKRFGKVSLVHISTNLIQAAVINKFRQLHGCDDVVPCPVSLEHLELALSLLDELTTITAKDALGQVALSRLMVFYRDAGARILDRPSRFPFRKDAESVRKIYSNENLDAAIVTSYDPWRYQALAKLVFSLEGLPHDEVDA